MRRADFHGPLRMVSAIRIRYRFRNKIKCMRRKIKRKNVTFFRPLRFEKRKLFPLVFHLISEKWLLFCGYATFQHLACERQTFLLAYRLLGSLKFAKRLSAAMSKEKRLPFATPTPTPVILYIYISGEALLNCHN